MSKQTVPTVSGEDLDTINERFQVDGFVVVENAVPKALNADVKSEINKILTAEAERHLPTTNEGVDKFDACLKQLFDLDSQYRGRLYGILQDLVSINRLCTSEDILEVVHSLGVTAPNVRNFGTRIDIPGEDDYLQPIHQDVNSMRTENCVNCWIPLQDVTAENGALRIWRGSHEIGPIRADEKELNESGYESIPISMVKEYEEHHCSIDAGSVLFFHPYLVHASSTNRSNHIRWTNIIRYDDAAEMFWLRDGENPYETLRRDDAN
jgi:ectoine hydroxylase-related dioxygenase (phytanoyl-CoA dioxygenase family)